MRCLRAAPALVVLLLFSLAVPQAASAKGLGPIRVVAGSGTVGWIRGASARAWWADLDSPQSYACVCNSPADVAKFEQRFFSKARWTFHEDGSWPTAVRLIQSGHGGPWLYYPASRTTPPYIVAPGGLGTQHLTWDEWKKVTPRMESLIETALRNASVATHTGSAGFPTGWVVAGALGALLLAGLLLRYTTKFTSLRGTTIVLRGSPPSK